MLANIVMLTNTHACRFALGEPTWNPLINAVVVAVGDTILIYCR
jgi:hypothetical protein